MGGFELEYNSCPRCINGSCTFVYGPLVKLSFNVLAMLVQQKGEEKKNIHRSKRPMVFGLKTTIQRACKNEVKVRLSNCA